MSTAGRRPQPHHETQRAFHDSLHRATLDSFVCGWQGWPGVTVGLGQSTRSPQPEISRPLLMVVLEQQRPSYSTPFSLYPTRCDHHHPTCIFLPWTGAVYVDAGGCSDLEPIHAILARVIPSYKHGRRLQEPRQPPHPRHPHPHGAMEPPPRPPAEEPRKLMNLAHR